MARRLASAYLAALAACGFAAGAPPATQLAPATDDLSFAAACLDRGEETAAAAHLSRHLAANPDQSLVRFSLGELLWRLDRFAEAGNEYERFLNDTSPSAGNVNRVVQAHIRLVAIAEQAADSYREHLHRGIGLYLLAEQAAEVESAEGLFCKSAGELTLAARARPTEARPHWYLHLVWSRLAQSQPAERHLRQAIDLAGHADLTPAERRELALADERGTVR
jgi:tetratricopeptide (TPR) repeat protein